MLDFCHLCAATVGTSTFMYVLVYMYEDAGSNRELAVEQRACLLLSLGLLDYVMCSGFDKECYYIPVVP